MNQKLGAYELRRELGAGAMGIVYEAWHPELQTSYALKVLRPELANATDEVRFQREIESMAAVSHHPNVVRIHTGGADAGRLYYVMDLVEGGNLKQRLATQGPLEPRQAAEITRDIADALAALHARGMIHRDIKPENILLGTDGRPRLTDFGLARVFTNERGRLTVTGELIGTPYYMAPEQALCDTELGPPVDVYALGAVLYTLIAGRPPIDGTSAMAVLSSAASGEVVPLSNVAPHTPDALAILCERALALAPTDRPSASELKRSLNGFLQTRAGGPTAGQSATARRLRRVGTLLAVLIAVLGTATAVVVAKRRAGQESAETAADDPLASALAALASPPENTRPERLRTAHKELVAAPKAKTREARDRARAYLALLKAEIALETRSVEDAHSASFALDRVAARIYGEQPGLTLIRVRLALLAKLPSAALKILPRDAPPLLRCKVYAATEEWEHLKKLTTETQDPKTLALAHLHLGRKILKTDAQKARAHFAYAGAAPDHPLRKAIAREAAEHVRSLHRKLWSKIGETSREVEIRKALHMAHAWLVAKEFGEEPTPQDLTNLWDWFFKHGGSLKSKDMALLLALAPENKVYLAAFCYRALREGVADPEFDLPQFQLAIEVAERTPEPPRLVYENMARALEALLRVDELAQFAKRVEERHSKQPELVSCVFAIHGRLLVGLGRHDEALPSLNASIELIPTQSVALYARFVVESARLGDGDVAPPQLLKDGWAWINNNRVDTGKIYRRRVGEALAKLELAASGPSRCADVLDLMLSDVPETLDLAIWRAQVLVAQTPLDTKRLAAALTALKESAAARRIEYQRFFARRPGDLAAHKRGLARLDAIPITGVPRMLRLLADGNLEQLEADLKTLRAAP